VIVGLGALGVVTQVDLKAKLQAFYFGVLFWRFILAFYLGVLFRRFNVC
jgi:hypothetical protein